MAAPTIVLCRKMYPFISLRKNVFSCGFQSVLCSQICHGYLLPNFCVQRYHNNCIKKHIWPSFDCQNRFYSFRGFRGQLTFDTPKKSQDFVTTLMANERKILLQELQNFQERVEMKEKTPPIPPTRQELKQVLVYNAIPFVGFGFLDNAIMICAGDYIDISIGAALCISTMAAAALGNLISDMAGIGLAGYVETITMRFGVQAPPLTLKQLEMTRTKWMASCGRGLGIFIGCILGMFPLLFLKTRKNADEPVDRLPKDDLSLAKIC